MKSLDYRARFIELASEINTGMPQHVVYLIGRGLNRFHKSINGSKVLILGVAYKRDIDDVRESPALDVMRLLEQDGAEVNYFDPYVPQINWNSSKKSGLKSLENIDNFDVTVILTDHSNVNYEFVRKNSDLIIDTRNVYPYIKDENIIRLGVGEIIDLL